MRMLNETAAGEYASNKARYLRDDIDKAKDRALQALRDGRFADYDAAKAEAERLRQQAARLRDLAARGMRSRAFTKEADRCEAEAAALDARA